jgi:transcriptional regulator with XRE-family HTH domain
MTQGERIKYIRQQRGFTQQQLGEICGFSDTTAGVRIRQYESNKKSPKNDTLMLIAHALKVNYIAIKNYDLGCAEDILETLFWLDCAGNTIELFALNKENDYKDNWKYRGSYNDEEYMSAFAPYGIVINYGLVNEFMEEWFLRKQELARNEITQAQYNNWKWNCPNSCDGCKNSESYIDWKSL